MPIEKCATPDLCLIRAADLSRLRVLVSGSYMEVQGIANQAPLVKFGIAAPRAMDDANAATQPFG